MLIGIIGTRGIPNQYGGFEQFAENIAPALVKRGHEVYVYNSSLHPFKETTWNGVKLIRKYDPENRIGTAGQFIYDFQCILDSRERKFDIILQLGYTSSSIWSFLFPKQSVVITNMDGLEWKRSKYSRKTQNFLKRAEKWAVAHSEYLIADSRGIQRYLLDKYQKEAYYIPYGAQAIEKTNDKILEERGLIKFSYNLIIARMEPENNIETIIRGHVLSKTNKILIIIGSYTNKFGKYLQAKYNSTAIQFWGAIYDLQALNNLRCFSYLYFHGHSVGGTNPSLLEAMASYSLIAANNNVFNKAILEEDAFYFSSENDVAELLNRNVDREEFSFMIENNANKIKNKYSWEHITSMLENLLIHAIKEVSAKRK